jgi:alkanesulfonate monooxygenase SsuD/methylene tetrahydromethanopterin reductase-like flavin-dependent oxidoreductase (luciferase family)/predicted kinase
VPDPSDARLPDPALVVLVGASGAGKSTWARARYRAQEVVSSDDLRGVVGSGPHDLDASGDAFDLLERIVAARLGRRLTTVVDTLGLDPGRRTAWLARARDAGLPAVAVVLATSAARCRERNGARDRPVPAKVLAGQLAAARDVGHALANEDWDVVRTVADDVQDAGPDPQESPGAHERPAGPADDDRRSSQGLRVVLQLSRFPWGEEPGAWVASMARAADEAGFWGLSLMDHLVQIPQVGRAWEPIPEPWVTLGAVAGLGTGLHLGPLVSPVTLRPAGVTAKAAATLDVLTGGRAFLGLGAGWWEREHAGHGIAFPPAADRLDLLEATIETCRALWAAGTREHEGERVRLPETTSYPRPVHDVPVVVGGSGARTLRIGARLADAVNVRTDQVDRALAAVRGTDVRVTVLDLPVVGRDRDDVWARVERLRGRTAAATYAARTHAGTVADHRDRWGALAAVGVDTIFLGVPDLATPEDVAALAGLTR